MNPYNKTDYQRNQIKVINKIESQVKNDSLTFSTVSPVKDYESDGRICLTSVHFPNDELADTICKTLIDPLKSISPEHYYYPKTSLHLTVKNIRLIKDPPNFTKNDVMRAKKVFSRVVPRHRKYKTYFYRLFLFKSNLSLIGTTDEELDDIVLDLDRELRKDKVPDDKVYANSRYFFCNMTLVRFIDKLSDDFLRMIEKLSGRISIPSYTVDSITLLTSNAVMEYKKVLGHWKLQ